MIKPLTVHRGDKRSLCKIVSEEATTQASLTGIRIGRFRRRVPQQQQALVAQLLLLLAQLPLLLAQLPLLLAQLLLRRAQRH
jgi:hypothetical protein